MSSEVVASRERAAINFKSVLDIIISSKQVSNTNMDSSDYIVYRFLVVASIAEVRHKA